MKSTDGKPERQELRKEMLRLLDCVEESKNDVTNA
jgi:hypothetical protein